MERLSLAKGIWMRFWYRLRYGRSVSIGERARFSGSARINLLKGTVEIGRRVSMKTNAYIAAASGGKVVIGDNVSIARNSMIICHDAVTIGDHCAIAPNVAVYDHDHKFGAEGLCVGFNTTPVVIEKNVWIGVGVIILRGSHIGEGSVIGVGCVVKGNIPPHSLVTQDRSLNIKPLEERG